MSTDPSNSSGSNDTPRRASKRVRHKPLEPVSAAAAVQLAELPAIQLELARRNEELRDVRAALEESRERITVLYDNAPLGYGTLDREGIIGSLNLTAARMAGVAHDGLIGRRFASVLVEADRRAFGDFLGLVFTVATKHRVDLALARDGRPPLEVRIEATPDAGGRSCQIVLTDVTEGKQAEITAARSDRELAVVTDLLATLSDSLELSTVLNRALRGVLDLTGLEAGTVCLLDAARQRLDVAAEANAPLEFIREFTNNAIKVGDCLCGYAANTGLPLILWDNASTSSYATNEAMRHAGIRCFIAIPLLARKRCIGVLCAFSRSDRKPTPRSVDLACDLGGPIAAVADNALLFEAANREVAERKHTVAALEETRRSLTTLIANLPGLVYRCRNDADWTTEFVSDGIAELTGYATSDFTGHRRHFGELIHRDDQGRVSNTIQEAVRGRSRYTIDYRITTADGSERWVWEQGCGIFDDSGSCIALEGLVIDVTQAKQTEGLAKGQRQLLERIANGAPLADTLDAAARFVEAQASGVIATILLLDDDGIHLRHGAAPSLPAEFVTYVDGTEISPTAGSCGTAVYRKAPVYVADIATDPLWTDHRAAALPLGLRACWSAPIFDERRRVLGTFALYQREPGLPDSFQLRLIALATHVAAIAIDRQRCDQALRDSEAKFATLFERAPFGVALIRLEDRVIAEVNQSFEQLLGFTRDEVIGRNSDELGISPDIQARAEILAEIGASGTVRQRELTLRTKSGAPRDLLINLDVIELNGCPHVVCTSQDITERKCAEAQVQRQLDELRRWHQVLLGREDRMLGLKREVNELLQLAGQPARYPSVADTVAGAGSGQTT